MAKLKIKDPVTGKCCCGGGTCAIFCSTRGGTAVLCGFAEFTSPSLPPKKYRKVSFSGTIHGDVFTDPACSGASGGYFDVDYSGDAEVYASSCALLSHGTQSISENGGTPVLTDLNEPIAMESDCFGTVTASQTEQSSVQNDACCPTGISAFQHHSGGNTQTLSVEDTEADAIERIPGINTWSGYSSCSGSDTCCRTTWQLRGPDEFSFEYVESRIKVQGGTASPSQHVNVKVELWRRAYGVGLYALYQTLQDDVTSGLDSSFSVDFGVVNNTIGFETVCRNCSVETL